MHQKRKDIQNRYNGFLQTSCLWNGLGVFELNQFNIETRASKIDLEIDDKLRLGKYIERFISYQLEQEESISIICENIQIQKNKITLGELDCILLKDEKPIHLEIIYKFYLYDSEVGKTEIEHFIGPNRKDSLLDKLIKLKEKQLPLLYSNECVEYLKSINLNKDKIEQQVYFKGQFFVPYSNLGVKLTALNQDCICGFYINKKELNEFKDCSFYIPNKKDWLVIPHQDINWLNFNQFKEKTTGSLEREFSQLCWIKEPTGEIKKFFLVWWT
jgi:hypothetical protein